MGTKRLNKASDEVLAAFLDGNATAEESQCILDALVDDAGLREILRVSHLVDADLGLFPDECECLPMTAMAASCEDGAFCCLECEKYVMSSFDVPFDGDELLADAVQNGWMKEDGTALHNVGRHLEKKGLLVSREYKKSLSDLAAILAGGGRVIVAVDGGELLGNSEEERREDIFVGEIPDHTVVVLSVDFNNQIVKLFDPNSSESEDEYPLSVFEDAWNDSKNYLVAITQRNE